MPPNAFVWFLLFCAFRIANVFLIQSQFDPDEYWQQLEPAYCQVFFEHGKPCPGLTWEWKRRAPSYKLDTISDYVEMGMHGPVRSYASILPTLGLYYAVKFFRLDTPWMIARGPVFLNAVLVAAPTDWSIWYLSRWMWSSGKEQYPTSTSRWYVYGIATSWFCAYALVRTYSNSLETLLLTVSVCLVSPELLGGPKSETRNRILRSCLAFFLGGLSCSIRFTCLAAFVPMGLLLSMQLLSTSVLNSLLYLLCACATFGLAGIATTVTLDRYMYGLFVFPTLGNFHFNVILGNGRLYGTHPFHWYLTTGIPAISGILTPFLVYDLANFRQWSRARRNLWMVCGSYTLAHSFSEHKEFRFLLPILPLFCLLSGKHIETFAMKVSFGKQLLSVGAFANLVAVLYLGLVHQRAPIEVNRHIVKAVKSDPQTYTIHYLMGCHSTPLLSHLHDPPVHFEPWTLDCSPSCRADPKVECESERFTRDPGQFMEDEYFHCSDFEDDTCVTDLRILYPDFLVADAGYLRSMQSRIATMGMKEVGRFVNGINGLKVGHLFTIGADAFANGSFSTLSFLGGRLVLSLDEFVLFENRQTISY